MGIPSPWLSYHDPRVPIELARRLCLISTSSPTSIQEILAPITTIKSYSSGWLHILGGDGQLSFQYPGSTPTPVHDVPNLFVTGAVREFHLNFHTLDPGGCYLSRPLERLPALEALVLSEMRLPSGSLSALTKELILCPSLKTIAFFDCVVNSYTIKELEWIQAKRRDSTAAQLYRVVIVNNTNTLPDLQLIHWLRKFVPRVDIGVGKLPDLL